MEGESTRDSIVEYPKIFDLDRLESMIKSTYDNLSKGVFSGESTEKEEEDATTEHGRSNTSHDDKISLERITELKNDILSDVALVRAEEQKMAQLLRALETTTMKAGHKLPTDVVHSSSKVGAFSGEIANKAFVLDDKEKADLRALFARLIHDTTLTIT
jgi:hypothetical protein